MAVNRNGSETQEPVKKMTSEEKAIRNEPLQSGESFCQVTSEEQLLPWEESIKQRNMHKYKFGVKSPHSMKLHLKIKSPTGAVEDVVKQTRLYQDCKNLMMEDGQCFKLEQRSTKETCEPILCNGGNASS
ncbi:hypothetical protein QL285_010194 [Trifolium repens]|nr:hypothetical protein QL285_010194 [Trifolium repens]